MVNPDQIAASLLREQPGLGVDAANLEAAHLTEASVLRCLLSGDGVLVETVLSTTKYESAVRLAHERGYRVGMIYVGLPDVRYSILRVRQRVESGGHDVPEDKLRARWTRSHDNLVRFAPLVDDLFVFSNGGTIPRLVALKRDGGVVQWLLPDALPEVARRLK